MKDKSTNSNVKKNVNKKSKTRGKNINKKKNSRRLSIRGITTIAIIVLILLMILIILVSSFINKNDIQKVSSRLNDGIGKSISDVEKSTKIDFFQSASNELLANLTKFNYIATPSTNVRVCGVKLPKWVIYAKINKTEKVTNFTIYNFDILKDNILGVETANPIDTSNLVGTSEIDLTNYMGIQPYVYKFLEDGSKELFFKYYYRDNSSKNDTAIQVCVTLDVHGIVTNVLETNVDFISNVLSLEEVS